MGELLDRRELLKRGAIAGGALWATPIMHSVGLAQADSEDTSPGPCSIELTASLFCSIFGARQWTLRAITDCDCDFVNFYSLFGLSLGGTRGADGAWTALYNQSPDARPRTWVARCQNDLPGGALETIAESNPVETSAETECPPCSITATAEFIQCWPASGDLPLRWQWRVTATTNCSCDEVWFTNHPFSVDPKGSAAGTYELDYFLEENLLPLEVQVECRELLVGGGYDVVARSNAVVLSVVDCGL